MKAWIFALLASLWICGCTTPADEVASRDTATDAGTYPKRFPGKWLSPRNHLVTFYPNGTWSIQKLGPEKSEPSIAGRRWRVDGNQFFLTYPTDEGKETLVRLITSTYTIDSFERNRFDLVTDEGYHLSYNRFPLAH